MVRKHLVESVSLSPVPYLQFPKLQRVAIVICFSFVLFFSSTRDWTKDKTQITKNQEQKRRYHCWPFWNLKDYEIYRDFIPMSWTKIGEMGKKILER